VRPVLLVIAMLAACAKQRVEAAPPPPADPARALSAALGQRAAGAYRFRGTSRLSVTEDGQAVEDLEEVAAVEQAANGDLHASYANSREQGRELYRAGDAIWVRPRYGKFHHRPPVTPDEATRAAAETAGAFAADFELVAAAAEVREVGPTTVAGRPARKLTLARGTPRPRHTGTWRDGATVEALDGEVALDAATGALLEGKLAARIAFQRDGKSFALEVAATHSVTDVGGAVAIAPPGPEDSVATPGRSSELADREELLDGLAAPARRRGK
jgi:hypothetical protein